MGPAIHSLHSILTVASGQTARGFLGWGAVEVPMFIALPVLLVLSGFFSGSETALFGMTEAERLRFRQTGGVVGRSVEILLAHQRMLLITLLLGNMAVNVLYFVITSMLMLRAEVNVVGDMIMAVMFLLVIILVGEVMPKMLANGARTPFTTIVAPPMVVIHEFIGPLRIVLDRLVIGPLSRLTAPSEAPPQLDEDELKALLADSTRAGVIDPDEQRILREVLELRQRKVRDVMTPRVRLRALPVDASSEDVVQLVQETKFTRVPVYEDDVDHIIGLLDVKPYLLASRKRTVNLRAFLRPVHYVPQTARLDQLLEHFQSTHTRQAIVVDEYGGTAGIVAIKDVVEELVGEIPSSEGASPAPPKMIGAGRWRVDGDVSVHEWAQAFGQRLVSPRVATLGGLMFERLKREPQVGDVVEIGNVRLEVEELDGTRIKTVIVSLIPRSSKPVREVST